jgi:hypothetical protein
MARQSDAFDGVDMLISGDDGWHFTLPENVLQH